MVFSDFVGMLMRGAYLSFHRRAQATFSQLGVTADQYVMLSVLAEKDNCTQKELARRSYSDANTITAMVNRLEEHGLVERRSCERDRRVWRISLTAKGLGLHEQLEDLAATFHPTLEKTLAPHSRDEIIRWLRNVIEQMNGGFPGTRPVQKNHRGKPGEQETRFSPRLSDAMTSPHAGKDRDP